MPQVYYYNWFILSLTFFFVFFIYFIILFYLYINKVIFLKSKKCKDFKWWN